MVLFEYATKGEPLCLPILFLPFMILFWKAVLVPKNIAAAVGKPYSTLLREVNPFDDGAKLGAETLVDIMRVTGNIQPLEHIAEQFGYELKRTH